MTTVWSDLHQNYKDKDWIDKPSLFAETAIQYFPEKGRILELGAGQGQDSRYFAEHGHEVLATDIEESALEISRAKLTEALLPLINFQRVDLSQELPFEAETFDVVYAHLSLHYFDQDTTTRLLHEIRRVLKPGGTLAFLVNSTDDPEYGTGQKIEANYFKIGKTAKRFFSTATARELVQYFDVTLLDNLGETYKDSAKGVHNLIRYIGSKPLRREEFKTALPFVGGIIEREHDGNKEVLLQIRWQPDYDPLYSGTFEFVAGKLDKPYENIFDAISREVREETGLTLKSVIGEDRTKIFSPQGTDAVFAFRPFCCIQQLKDGKPWVGFIFIVEVEDGEPKAQLSETKDVHWVAVSDVKNLFEHHPEKLFGLEVPAWEYYFRKQPE